MMEVDEPMKLKDIAEAEGITHQAVADILNRAFRKMRYQIEEKGYTAEDLLP